MSLPQLLLVDDSEAVLAFESAALSRHYAIATALNGRDALEKARQLLPAAILLDLSMPEMDGDEVLDRLRADERLRAVPVIIVSSESQRARACLRKGAKAFLEKPVRAQDLLPLVERVLAEARAEARAGGLAVLFVTAGGSVGDMIGAPGGAPRSCPPIVELGLPLASVRTVLHQLATRPLSFGPSYLSEVFELYGETVPVLDLPRRLGVEHALPLPYRKLVVVQSRGAPLALCVDEVRDPEELAAADLTPREQLAAHERLQDALIAVARTPRGPVPIVDPGALVSRDLLSQVSQLVAQRYGLGGAQP